MNRNKFKPDGKKIWKVIGNVAVIFSVIFVINRFWGMDINVNVFLTSPMIIISLALAVISQTITLCVGCFPWLKFIEIFSGKKIPFYSAMTVYTKSNIYKYVPGNVFQYVGRNKLAADMEISNVDVACATILDVVCGIIPLGIISLCMLGNYFFTIMNDYWDSVLTICLIGVVIIAIVVGVIFLFRKKLASYLNKYKTVFAKKNRGKFLAAVVYYVAITLFSIGINLLTAYFIFDSSITFQQLIMITGAYTFAFILGYITPGAPGGIGIRESIMLLVCNGIFEESVLIYVLLYRLSSIITDILGLIIGVVGERINKNKLSEA